MYGLWSTPRALPRETFLYFEQFSSFAGPGRILRFVQKVILESDFGYYENVANNIVNMVSS